MCLLYQVMNPQIRKGSSHARPLQHLHGNPHNQWQSINGLAPLLSTRTKPLEVSGCRNEHLQTCWARKEIFECSLDWCHTGPHCHAHARRALGSGGENICPQALLQEHPNALCGRWRVGQTRGVDEPSSPPSSSSRSSRDKLSLSW